MLVDATTAGELSIESGDRVRVVLALGTPRETRAGSSAWPACSRASPASHDLRTWWWGWATYAAATTSGRIDFFLARTSDHSHAGLARAVAALRAGGEPLAIQTTEGAFDEDQSSLTALDVRSLVDLGSLFTLLMSAAVIAIFTFGLILQRRRELVVLRAQGMHAREVRSLVLGEAALVACGGILSGLLAGACSGFLLVQALRSLFIVPPSFALPASALAGLVLAAVVATFLSAAAAMLALRQVRPTEILREP